VVKSATMGGLGGYFTKFFWITNYLQRPIYVWNKMSKHIMWNGFSNYPLYIAYDFQHFEPIEYANGMARFLLAFETMISRLL
jgi:hypothetical protein